LEQERRSLAMLPAGPPSVWSRDKIGNRIRELQEAQRTIVDLERRPEAELTVQDAAVREHPTGGNRGSSE
jgi:hypothetical protein